MNKPTWPKIILCSLLISIFLASCQFGLQKIDVGTTETKRAVTTLLPKEIALQYLQSKTNHLCQFQQEHIVVKKISYPYEELQATENTLGSESFVFVNAPNKKGSQVVCSWTGLSAKDSRKILTSLVSLGVNRSCKSFSHIERIPKATELLPKEIALPYLQNNTHNACQFHEKGVSNAQGETLPFEQLRVAAERIDEKTTTRTLSLFQNKENRALKKLCSWQELPQQSFDRILTALFSLGVAARCR